MVLIFSSEIIIGTASAKITVTIAQPRESGLRVSVLAITNNGHRAGACHLPGWPNPTVTPTASRLVSALSIPPSAGVRMGIQPGRLDCRVGARRDGAEPPIGRMRLPPKRPWRRSPSISHPLSRQSLRSAHGCIDLADHAVSPPSDLSICHSRASDAFRRLKSAGKSQILKGPDHR
jgi:hypothetical protein